jgi:uracil-DNA glycosylase family 4
MENAKDKIFSNLVAEVRACTLCERMCNSSRVLSFAAGNLHAKLMFIGEAPGRLGADQTEIPFHGDAAGKNFEDHLASSGILRDQVFISNAVLCNPKDDRGNNSSPNPQEMLNCSAFLRRQIELINPSIVVALGSVALRSTALIEYHSLTLAQHVRTANIWFGRILIPLYHPGQRAMVHRSFANQRSDYQFVAEQSRRLTHPVRPIGGTTRKDILTACRYLLARRGELSYFELHKLAYLAEYLHVRSTGERLTRAFFIRQKDGPYCTDLHINRLKQADPNLRIVNRDGKLFIRLGATGISQLITDTVHQDSTIRGTLDEVISRYSFSNEADLKRAVYLTAPMRLILRREKHDQINLYNAPIDFLVTGKYTVPIKQE